MLKISDKTVIKLHPLERQVLEEILSTPAEGLTTEDLKVLEQQFGTAIILSRKMTGHGFFTMFLPDKDTPRLANKKSFWFTGKNINITKLPGVPTGTGYQLHIKDGAIDELEGFAYAEPWPDPWPGQYDEEQKYIL